MTDTTYKDTNPKDAAGIKKAPMSTVPSPVLLELGVAMLEGARKYGRSNYRVAGVRGSVYYDATMRHLMQWWEGEDIDPDSGLNHIVKALASLVVLRDTMLNSMWTDDRPPKAQSCWLKELNDRAGAIVDKYPDAVVPFTQVNNPHPLAGDPIEQQTFNFTATSYDIVTSRPPKATPPRPSPMVEPWTRTA